MNLKISNIKVELIDKALLIDNILVIADLHIGYEETLNQQGIFLPRSQFQSIKKDLDNVFKKIKKTDKIEEIVILGDLKHEFSGISEQEWQEVSEILDYLALKCKKIILIRGNHDTILPFDKKNIKVRDFYIKNDVGFFHGHRFFNEILDKKIKILVLGHKHPAITIRDKVKSERYKCFLIGKWKDKEVVVMPSFFPLIEGSDIFIEDTNLALNLNFKNFKVYVIGPGNRRVYEFGKLGNFGRLV